jgi:hypothetical protein
MYSLSFSAVRSLKCSTADREVADIIRAVTISDYAQHIVKALNTVRSLHKFGTHGAISYDLDSMLVC